MANRFTAALLLSDHADLAPAAEQHAREQFDLLVVSAQRRGTGALPRQVLGTLHAGRVDFLLNYLSPTILPPEILALPRQMAINFHPAPPRWPGVGSASLALYHGDATFGATAHVMTPAIDAGPILGTHSFAIDRGDDCASLFERGLVASLGLFREITATLAAAGELTPSGETWARPAVTRREFEAWMTLKPTDSAREFERKIRACRHPRFPGPFVELHGHRFALPPAAPRKAA